MEIKKIKLGAYIRLIHLILLIVILTGWLWVPVKYLGWYLLFILVVVGHWPFFDNKCALTVWEQHVEGPAINVAPFNRRVLEFFGIGISDQARTIAEIIIAVGVCVAASIRIALSKFAN